MTTLSTVPEYPLPGGTVKVSFTLGGSGADYVRVWVTDAPPGSSYRTALDKGAVSRLEVFKGDGDSIWETSFDKGGAYVFAVQEYTKLASAYGPRYQGDTAGAQSETLVGAEQSLKLYLGQRMTVSVGAGQDTAQLVLHVWNATIRPTSVATHGILSPAIVNPSTPRAATAISATAVQSALTALHNVAASTAIGSPTTILANIITKFNAHRTQASVHTNNDSDNVVSATFGNATTPQQLATQIAQVASFIRRHVQNDDTGSGPNSAASPYHGTFIDWVSLPIPLQNPYAAIADLWRCYESHRANDDAHGSIDSTNTLTVLPVLGMVHVRFLEVLASLSPTVPETQSTAAVLLAANCGFIES